MLMEFGIPMKLVRLVKMCLPEMYSRVQVGKNLSDIFPITNDLKQGDALLPLLLNSALEYTIMSVQVKCNLCIGSKTFGFITVSHKLTLSECRCSS